MKISLVLFLSIRLVPFCIVNNILLLLLLLLFLLLLILATGQ